MLTNKIEHGTNGETYNIGGGNERENRAITQKILDIIGKPASLIKQVADRQGHDRRYSISSPKLENLGFRGAGGRGAPPFQAGQAFGGTGHSGEGRFGPT